MTDNIPVSQETIDYSGYVDADPIIQPNQADRREAVARIIDPGAMTIHVMSIERWDAALAKADAILALPADPVVQSDEVARLIEPLLKFHESGGHEGDGSDERIAAIRTALSGTAPATTGGE